MMKLLFSIFILTLYCFANEINFQEEIDNEQGNNNFVMNPLDIKEQVMLSPNEDALNRLMIARQSVLERSGRYFMVNIGLMPYTRRDKNTNFDANPISFGVRGGAISYLFDNMAIRGYIGFDVSHDSLNIKSSKNFNSLSSILSLGIDIMIDFLLDSKHRHYGGFFLGFGFGAFYYHSNSNILDTNFILQANVLVQGGIDFLIFRRHRIEIGARLLPTQSLDLQNDFFQSNFMPYIGYSYKF